MLIDNWRNAYRMLSVQLGALVVTWAALPADQQAAVLALLPWRLTPDTIAGLLAVAAILGRLVKQPSVSSPPAPAPIPPAPGNPG